MALKKRNTDTAPADNASILLGTNPAVVVTDEAEASTATPTTTHVDTADVAPASPANPSPANPRGPGLRWNEDRDRTLVLTLASVGGEDPQALLEALSSSEAFAGVEGLTLQKVRSRRNRLNDDVFVPAGKSLPEIAIKRGGYVPPADLANLFDGEGASASV